MPQYYCSAFSISVAAEFDLQILTGIQQCVAHFKYTIKAMFELQNQKEPYFPQWLSHTQASRRLRGHFMNQMQNTEIVLSPSELLSSSLKDVLSSNITQLFIVAIL